MRACSRLRTYGLSRQHIYRLLNRYQLGGLDPSARRPANIYDNGYDCLPLWWSHWIPL
ncbi:MULTISPECIES: helix-turn-helix domain-containing protein [unclassified Mycolicibacterium]|uniref:helix-turn-helix domain-containing protein n=1 Tax=unclassified Mycolicibacterium TaxID=2636767 RepID=UPI0012DDE449|nr:MULTISPECIES: helix-turn-helix domain-containing protein [unclassified Mycolicibacterium]MUL80823.1 helix-turn-helix domain-containing protein [Mycolicibacterium sp. CBMA 329]MUL86589.1 helix-turn-helix domain-containing protein [Mycolicibacterium sp. CBMA 331]MUM02794.1 helix-turn-helix domain-containing protein [Mycolicibacterium sp. CBMA 334]MUM36886.1 helix-turn-helix domain-containing protein [Mycolicibacterium sp. CBMA 247]MUM42654.1 helix-turn-helix domain-containing protein [Mycolic